MAQAGLRLSRRPQFGTTALSLSAANPDVRWTVGHAHRPRSRTETPRTTHLPLARAGDVGSHRVVGSGGLSQSTRTKVETQKFPTPRSAGSLATIRLPPGFTARNVALTETGRLGCCRAVRRASTALLVAVGSRNNTFISRAVATMRVPGRTTTRSSEPGTPFPLASKMWMVRCAAGGVVAWGQVTACTCVGATEGLGV